MTIAPDQQTWTACGEDTKLRLNLTLRAKGNASIKATIETLSFAPLATRAC
jgi:hypothetical protein